MMKLKKLFRLASLAVIIAIPSLYGMKEKEKDIAPASTLVAVEVPNKKETDLGQVLAKYAKKIESSVQTPFNKKGLKFIALKAHQMHLTLFDAPISSNKVPELAREMQNEVKKISKNSFYPTQLGTVKQMSNSIVVTITGPGNTSAQTIANYLNSKMGNVSLAYNGHISIARIKLTSQKPGQPTTQVDKDEIEKILSTNPQLMKAVTATPLPNIKPFGLHTIYISHGGGKDAKDLAKMQIRDIKANVGTPQSLVKQVSDKVPSESTEKPEEKEREARKREQEEAAHRKERERAQEAEEEMHRQREARKREREEARKKEKLQQERPSSREKSATKKRENLLDRLNKL